MPDCIHWLELPDDVVQFYEETLAMAREDASCPLVRMRVASAIELVAEAAAGEAGRRLEADRSHVETLLADGSRIRKYFHANRGVMRGLSDQDPGYVLEIESAMAALPPLEEQWRRQWQAALGAAHALEAIAASASAAKLLYDGFFAMTGALGVARATTDAITIDLYHDLSRAVGVAGPVMEAALARQRQAASAADDGDACSDRRAASTSPSASAFHDDRGRYDSADDSPSWSSAYPSVNVDGTPMVAGSCIDVHGHVFGQAG